MKIIFFKKSDVQGFALFIAVLERQGINYEINQDGDSYSVTITGYKV